MRVVERRLITPPASEPVTLDEAKAYARVSDAADDDLITTLIKAARERVEAITWRAIMPQTWALTLTGFPDRLRLPYPPFQSVSAVRYFDETGIQRVLGSSIYRVDPDDDSAIIGLAVDQDWPELDSDRPYPVTLEYIAGYADAASVPDSIKIATKIIVTHLFNNRELVIVGTSASPMPFSADALLNPYRVMGFA